MKENALSSRRGRRLDATDRESQTQSWSECGGVCVENLALRGTVRTCADGGTYVKSLLRFSCWWKETVSARIKQLTLNRAANILNRTRLEFRTAGSGV